MTVDVVPFTHQLNSFVMADACSQRKFRSWCFKLRICVKIISKNIIWDSYLTKKKERRGKNGKQRDEASRTSDDDTRGHNVTSYTNLRFDISHFRLLNNDATPFELKLISHRALVIYVPHLISRCLKLNLLIFSRHHHFVRARPNNQICVTDSYEIAGLLLLLLLSKQKHATHTHIHQFQVVHSFHLYL